VTIIKVLLLAAIVVVGLQAFRGGTTPLHRVAWRAYILAVLLGAALAVLFPDALTSLANLVGVARGADLLLYVLVVTFMLVTVVLFRRLAHLERRLTQLARRVAISDARADLNEDGD
jgi:hypothetical protein